MYLWLEESIFHRYHLNSLYTRDFTPAYKVDNHLRDTWYPPPADPGFALWGYVIPRSPKRPLISLTANQYPLKVFILGKYPSSFNCSPKQTSPVGHTPTCTEGTGTELHWVLKMGCDQPRSRQACHCLCFRSAPFKTELPYHCRHHTSVGSYWACNPLKSWLFLPPS